MVMGGRGRTVLEAMALEAEVSRVLFDSGRPSDQYGNMDIPEWCCDQGSHGIILTCSVQ